MNEKINMDKQKMVGMIVSVAVLAGLAGFMMGSGASGGSLGGGLNTSDQAKLEAARKMFPPMPDTNFISGQVKSVNGKVITLSTPTSNPFDESPIERKVTVTGTTKIVRNENKPTDVMQAEQAAFQKAMDSWKPGSTSGTPPTPPMFSVEKAITISDIKAGDQINVEAANPIRMVVSFDAVKITAQMSIGGPAGAALPPPAPANIPAPAPGSPAPLPAPKL